MSIATWLREREIAFKNTFSVRDVQSEFSSLSPQVIHNELNRLTRQRVILPVYRGFYVKLPAHYIAAGMTPPDFYIDQLMAYLGKPYYVGLLSAGELHGAAHQRPQRYSVFTEFPAARTSKKRNPYLDWHFRKSIPESLLQRINSETGTIRYSNPELTALDLVQYPQFSGGLSNVATVLTELQEKIDFSKVNETFFQVGTAMAYQRLGFILEETLGNARQSDILHARLKEHGWNFRWTNLEKGLHLQILASNNHWHVYINNELEVDDL
ncbi:MAG: type IV toxin-antitoxin system AbiEi family antitoxin [Victivallales bacterium]|nr:type IV toxin-antitoxin system AbiEi family antitoxin [Victivallales bacterium]